MSSSSPPSWESFNFDFSGAEVSVSGSEGSYQGLDPRALCTDPADIFSIVTDPLIRGDWVDLGSGFGHTVLSYATIFPDRMALGIEREPSRIREAQRLAREKNLSSARFIQGDLLTVKIPEAENYFLYFPQGHVLDRILSELTKLKRSFRLVAIESHGDLFPRLERERWLELKKEIPLTGKRHSAFARIYQNTGEEQELAGLHRYSFQKKYFLLRDELTEWWGNSFGLSASGDAYLLSHPPRTVRESQVVKIMTREELDRETSLLLILRELPRVSVGSQGRIYEGPIRKILKSPAFSVEFPGGERVEWKHIDWIKQDNHLCYDSSRDFFFLPLVP